MDTQINEDKEPECDVCTEIGIEAPSFAWCRDCGDVLCQPCALAHARVRRLRYHKLEKDADVLDEAKLFKQLGVKLRCQEHEDEILRFYCEFHGKVCCSLCVVRNHLGCDGVVQIHDLYDRIRDEHFEETLKIVNAVVRECDGLINERAVDLKSIDEKRLEIVKEIEELANKIHKHVDVMKSSAMDCLNQVHQLETSRRQAEIDVLETSNLSLRRTIKALELSRLHGSDRQMFVVAEDAKRKCRELIEEFSTLPPLEEVTFNFLPTMEFDAFQDIISLGEIGEVISTSHSDSSRSSEEKAPSYKDRLGEVVATRKPRLKLSKQSDENEDEKSNSDDADSMRLSGDSDGGKKHHHMGAWSQFKMLIRQKIHGNDSDTREGASESF